MDRVVYRCRVCRELIPIEQECASCGPRFIGNKIMSIEERKMTRPDSRWKAEQLGLYRSAESNRSQTTDEHERHYQTGVMIACSAIWNRVTGEELINLDNPQKMDNVFKTLRGDEHGGKIN